MFNERTLEPQPHEVSGEKEVDALAIAEAIDLHLSRRVAGEHITPAAGGDGLETKRVMGGGNWLQWASVHGALHWLIDESPMF